MLFGRDRYALHPAPAGGLPGGRPDGQRQPGAARRWPCRSRPPAARSPISSASSTCSCSTGWASACSSVDARRARCARGPRRSWSRRAISSAAFESRAIEHRLRVGATLTIGNYVAVPLMARFMREHPAIGLTLDGRQHRARSPARWRTSRWTSASSRARSTIPTSRPRAGATTSWSSSAARAIPLARKRALTRRGPAGGATWIVRERGSGTRQAFDRAMRGLLPQLKHGADAAATPRRSSAPSRPASGSAASRASRSRTRSSAAPSNPAGFRSGTSAASSSSCCTRGSDPAPAARSSTAGSPSVARG